MNQYLKLSMLTFFLALVFPVLSQEQKSDKAEMEQRIDMRLDKLEKELNLNPQQKSQLREIQLSSSQKKKELREQMRTVELERKTQIKAVLTPEQFEKMKALNQQRMKEKRSKKCSCGKKK
jgi:periplasmic protein CpxP/Spy